MTVHELIKLAQDVRSGLHESAVFRLAHGVIDMLTADKPCMADPADIVNVDSDGYVTIYAQQSLRADEAAWCAVEILKAVEKAKAQP